MKGLNLITMFRAREKLFHVLRQTNKLPGRVQWT